MSLPVKKVYMCLICDKKFSTHIHLIKHERLIHNIVKQYSEGTRVEKIHKCLDCAATFQYTGDLRNHLHTQHNVNNVIEELSFLSYNEFLFWLATEEKTHSIKYLKHNRIIRKGYIETSYLNCISGRNRSILVNRTRDKRKCGNSYCTSQIVVKRDVETDECSIQYFKTHYGHDHTTNFLRLITVDQKKIASQLIQGISPARILDSICHDTRPVLKRNLAIPQEVTDIKMVNVTHAENDNKSQLKKEIKILASQIMTNVDSEHYTVQKLSAVLQDLNSAAALLNSNIETNNYKPTTQITIQPAEEGTEGQPLLVKKKFITINKANLKPYKEDINGSIMENIVSGESSSENNSKDCFILL